ncbi:MAG: thioredoxin family protein [Amphritea sp.]|nr:thioredoxin family protein [Amphritea sp.]
MKLNSDLNTVLSEIEQSPSVLLYFSGENCSVCEALKPKIAQIVGERFLHVQQIEVHLQQLNIISSHFGVFSIPTILFFREGKEWLREGRNLSVGQLVADIKRIMNY